MEIPIDLSKFILVATISTANPQLSKEITGKLKHVQPFLDQYFELLFSILRKKEDKIKLPRF
jgi:hypothetical protein